MTENIGIFDPQGINPNPLTGEDYSEEYRKLGEVWSAFPAYEKASEVIDSIKNNQITFIISSTGSGKTVLIPKLALHYTNYKGKIGITLPKRVVALSAATFAAKTLDVTLGKEVGLSYKGSNKALINADNTMVYMTDGVLIMKYLNDPTLSEFNVIIIDEAHERKIQIDLLMLFLKNLLQSGSRPDLRVIIMSATIDVDKYKRYFSGISGQIIRISGQTNHKIDTYFTEKPVKSYMTEGLELLEKLIKNNPKSDMLFFITTSNEAKKLCKTLNPKYPRVYCIEVYADMDSNLKIYAEARDKFMELGDYEQKLVMATNVAESSLTIDGLKYVIDSGYELYSYFDPIVCGQGLEKKLITKAQALQRRGRVGRTEPGICYHLMTKDQFENLQAYPDPDILKQDITIVLLQIIQLSDTKNYADGVAMITNLMDPPSKDYVDLAKKLYTIYDIIDENGNLTKIGSEITKFSSLPINHILFLIYSYQLHCVKEATIIIAMIEKLSGNFCDLFYNNKVCESNYKNVPSAVKNLIHKKGDHFTYLQIYNEFRQNADRRAWTKQNGIKFELLNSINEKANKYYHKILQVSRAPQMSRVLDIDLTSRLIKALKLSHKHLTATNLKPVITKKQVNAQINHNSSIFYHYNKRDLQNKKFIYDELTNIGGRWEYNAITLI